MASKRELETNAVKKWGSEIPIRKLFELEKDEKCIVIGTLFKQMAHKPSVLRELSEDHNLLPQPPRMKYTDDSDELILEDALQRIVLKGDISQQALVTGVTAALLGSELEDQPGKFQVIECCFRTIPDQIPLPVIEEDRYVLLASGFNLGPGTEDLMPLEICIDVLSGQLGLEEEQNFASSISRMIIAGNLLGAETRDKQKHAKAKYISKNLLAGTIEGVQELDRLLVRLASTMHVDVMPGEFDPVGHALPQQPLHRCILPLASSYATLKTVTNPYECEIDGVRFLGSSGQSIDDIMKCSDIPSSLDALEATLVWGHISPTAPDTLGCYPYADSDPFLIERCPHVYFSGNMDSFSTRMYSTDAGHGVRLVCVPSFAKTGTCVLVNMRTLACSPMKVDLSLWSEADDSVDQ